MYRHLVAVEVRIERAADERGNLNRTTFDKHGLERLYGKAVQRRRAVQKHGVIFNDVFQNVPDHVLRFLDCSLCRFDVMALTALYQPLHDERLEKLDRHFLRKAALINFQLGPDDDNRTAGIVHSLAEKVLAETSLLAAEHARKGFELPIGGAAQRLAAAAVIDERVHRFLQHALFVLDNHIRRADFHHLFQTVIAVDDAAVKVVQVRRGKSAAVELHHGTDVGRNHRKHRKNHPFGAIAALSERFHYFEALDRLDRFLARRVLPDDFLTFLAFLFEIHRH